MIILFPNLSIRDLREVAASLEIPNYTRMKKEELIKAIKSRN